ncbi:MAG: metallophosphoesterase [Ilumatobacteraceae bacterium]
MTADVARIAQITDTHFSAALGVPSQWPSTVAWLRADRPDLLVHTGDIVLEDPDDDADRRFAKELMEQSPVPYVVIPGNHDVGSYGEGTDRPRRIAAFRETWGGDHFVRDLAGWRLVGVDAYRLATATHDAWLRDAVSTGGPVLVFVHQPIHGDQVDGWQMIAGARAAFERAIAGADVRAVASGHRHCARTVGRAVWAPSLRLQADEMVEGADPRPGLVEHVISADGGHHHRVVRPWELVTS